jgi:uncharacterized membrane protein
MMVIILHLRQFHHLPLVGMVAFVSIVVLAVVVVELVDIESKLENKLRES